MTSSVDWCPHEEKPKHTRAIQSGEAGVEDMPEIYEVRSGMEKGETEKWLLIVSHKTRSREH